MSAGPAARGRLDTRTPTLAASPADIQTDRQTNKQTVIKDKPPLWGPAPASLTKLNSGPTAGTSGRPGGQSRKPTSDVVDVGQWGRLILLADDDATCTGRQRRPPASCRATAMPIILILIPRLGRPLAWRLIAYSRPRKAPRSA